MDKWMTWRFYLRFKSISVNLERSEDYNETFCAIKRLSGSGLISPPAGFDSNP